VRILTDPPVRIIAWAAAGCDAEHGGIRVGMCRREPCPHRLFDDIGGAFGMGAGGGAIWHFFKGMKNSPKGAKVGGGIEVSVLSIQPAQPCNPPSPQQAPPPKTRRWFATLRRVWLGL